MVRNDSMVLMSDGASKRIDYIRVGERIQGDAGKRIPVLGRCFRIKSGYIVVMMAEKNEEIWCTPDQRFYSDYGLKRADDMKVGVAIASPDGYRNIIEIRWEPFNGVLRSLKLPESEHEKGLLVYANGFAAEVYSKE